MFHFSLRVNILVFELTSAGYFVPVRTLGRQHRIHESKKEDNTKKY